MSSTSKRRVEQDGMTAPTPCSPYACKMAILKLKCHEIFSLDGWDDYSYPLLAIRLQNGHILKLKCHEIFLLCVDGMTAPTLCSPYACKMAIF
jgi:hypothetical protein